MPDSIPTGNTAARAKTCWRSAAFDLLLDDLDHDSLTAEVRKAAM
jgi:hypothetical protein